MAPTTAIDTDIATVVDRVADRLIDAIEHDHTTGGATNGTNGVPGNGLSPLGTDERRQQLLVGAWINDEVAALNEYRLHQGDRPLTTADEQHLRARVVAELTGAGPLEPYLSDPTVEEVDVNSHMSTWVTYTDGRKTDVGQLWKTPNDLTSFQKRLALRMTGTGEGRLDTSSPMLTLQTNDGARVVMVLGGTSEHGISTHPRLAIRRFVVRQVGLTGLADRGLFPPALVGRLRALVRCGFTILVSGPPGAGKTTLLTELLGEVSPLERIITVEKNLLELRLEDDPRHPDAPALFTRHSNAEGEGEITTRQLVELTRRLNPDRVVVGELVEDEASHRRVRQRRNPRSQPGNLSDPLAVSRADGPASGCARAKRSSAPAGFRAFVDHPVRAAARDGSIRIDTVNQFGGRPAQVRRRTGAPTRMRRDFPYDPRVSSGNTETTLTQADSTVTDRPKSPCPTTLTSYVPAANSTNCGRRRRPHRPKERSVGPTRM